MLEGFETIAAAGTPKGLGALGIVRISGPRTNAILLKSFESKKLSFDESHRAYFGLWKNPLTEQAIDEVVVVYFCKGRGFTGEDAVDIICHGGPQVIEMILSSILSAGASLAKPGEFTLRAVLNGKMDLAQAESVIQLIHANSPRAALQALEPLRGSLSRKLEKIESELIYVLAHLEASIDFTTEDIQPVDSAELKIRTDSVIAEIKCLLSGYVASVVVNRGLRVALIGKPNTGKSSLLNMLLEKKRSIVSEKPGTTRDIVEADIFIDGYLVKLIDTAGLRTTNDDVEFQGVEMAHQEFGRSDYLVYVVDSSQGLQNDDVENIHHLDPQKVLICFNKSDLSDVNWSLQIQQFGLQNYFWTTSSAVVENGCHAVRKTLSMRLLNDVKCDASFDVSTLRQKEALTKADLSLKRASALLNQKTSPEFVSLELREALSAIKDILGKDVSENVMDRVFKEFCIGK